MGRSSNGFEGSWERRVIGENLWGSVDVRLCKYFVKYCVRMHTGNAPAKQFSDFVIVVYPTDRASQANAGGTIIEPI